MMNIRYSERMPDCVKDIQIMARRLPSNLSAVTARGVLWQVAADRFLVEVPDVARYLVEHGRHIAIDTSLLMDDPKIRQFLHMAPLAAALYQRGKLALHAAAVATPQGCVLLAGESGVGKSTLLTVLLQRGWSLLADDLSIVDVNGRQPMVYPNAANVVLWQDALEQFGLSGMHAGKRQILDFSDQFAVEPMPLRAIYRLSVHSKKKIEMCAVAGAKRFSTLSTLLYNSHIADALLDHTAYFQLASVLAETVELYSLSRPRWSWSAAELADFVVRGQS